MTKLPRRALLHAPLLPLIANSAHAQGWPDRPIKLVVPYSAGSATDLLGRILSEPLSRALTQPIVLDNRPGGNSTLGTNVAARAAPDGYTLALATNAGLAASPAGLIENTPFDPVRDLQYVSLVGSISFVWVVNSDLAVQSARELVEYIKANPGKLNYASGNTGGIAYGGYIKNTYGLDIAHVPYRSTPPALTDLIGGQVQVMIADIASVLPMVRAGKVKPLGVPTATRNPLLPDVPTFAEQGLETPPDMSGWWAVVAPSGTPDTIMDRLNAELVRVLRLPEIRARLLDIGIVATPTTRSQAAEYGREQLEVWRRMVRDLHLAVT